MPERGWHPVWGAVHTSRSRGLVRHDRAKDGTIDYKDIVGYMQLMTWQGVQGYKVQRHVSAQAVVMIARRRRRVGVLGEQCRQTT